MTLTSISFAGFVLASLLFYYLLPRKFQWIILLLASTAFYLIGGGTTIIWLLYITLVAYVTALILDRCTARMTANADDKDIQEKGRKQKKTIVLIACILAFGFLFVMKYWNYSVSLMPESLSLPELDLLMPLGLSFFTFQSVGYIIDVYRKKYKAQRNFFKLALFVSFFPQIIQGPINRYNRLEKQLLAERSFDWAGLQRGVQLALWGSFMKLIIADRAAVIVNSIIFDGTPYGGAMLAVGIFFYCIQLYCDFAGGINIVRGVALMFGVEMAENFKRPIFANSLAEYWRRWHITLGAWMRDYLFYPMAFSKPMGRVSKWARQHLPGQLGRIFATSAATFMIYFVIGIWHGASFKFIAFGLYNGIIMTSSLLLKKKYINAKKRLHIDDKARWFKVFQIARTALIVFIGRYLTRAPGFRSAVAMLTTTITAPKFSELTSGALAAIPISKLDVAIMLIGLVILLTVEFMQERGIRVRKSLNQKPRCVQVSVLFVSLLLLTVFGFLHSDALSGSFIYMQY